MVKVYVDIVTKDVLKAAQIIAENQKENVQIITPEVKMEVHYEKEEKKTCQKEEQS